MNSPSIHFDANLTAEYETLRSQVLSAGLSSPISHCSRRVISEGMYQWAIGKKISQHKSEPSKADGICQIVSSSVTDFENIAVVNLIAAMTIQNITRNQRIA